MSNINIEELKKKGKPFARFREINMDKDGWKNRRHQFILCWRWREEVINDEGEIVKKMKSKDINVLSLTDDDKFFIDMDKKHIFNVRKRLRQAFEEKFRIELNTVRADKEVKEWYKILEDKVMKFYWGEDDWKKARNEWLRQKEEEDRKRKEQEEYKSYYDEFFGGNSCSGTSFYMDTTTKKFAEEIVKQGYKKASHKFHPDKGGATEDMQMLNKAKEELDNLLK